MLPPELGKPTEMLVEPKSPPADAPQRAPLIDVSRAGPPIDWAEVRRSPRDYERIKHAALARLPEILARWLPHGRREGLEWGARNPTRPDRRPGSFKVNLRTGAWSDFATGDRGGDVISLAAHLGGWRQSEA